GGVHGETNPTPSVRQVEGEPGRHRAAKLLCLRAAGSDVVHLDVDHAVEHADLAFRAPKRADRRPAGGDLQSLVATLDGSELPAEQLVVETLRLREVRRRDVEPGYPSGTDVCLRRLRRVRP